jgi:hypothetical protein
MISSIIILDIRTNNLKAIIENRQQIDQSLDAAIDDGITKLAEVDSNQNITISKDAAIRSFFLSLHSTLGILSDKSAQEKLMLYVPVVMITMEDGYYVFYSDEYIGNDGYTKVSKRWSEKNPYYYKDNDFIYAFTLGDVITLYDYKGLLNSSGDKSVYCMDYHDLKTKPEYETFRRNRADSFLLDNEKYQIMRKQTIISSMEESMAYYTSHHNKIALQYGITYNFSLPVIQKEEWAPYLDDISMFVVFQGYPYGNSGEIYNRVASAGAKVTKRDEFILEQKQWYLIYHRADCSELDKEGIIYKEEPLYRIEDCAEAGAYACPICFRQSGVHASEYLP